MSIWNTGVSRTLCAQIYNVGGDFGCPKCLYCLYSPRFWSLTVFIRADPGFATASSRMSGCPVLALGVLLCQLWGKHPRALTRYIGYSHESVLRATAALMSCSTVHPFPFCLFFWCTVSCCFHGAILLVIPQVTVHTSTLLSFCYL